MKVSSKGLVLLLVSIMLLALTPLLVKPAVGASPYTTDWLFDKRVSPSGWFHDGHPTIASDRGNNLYVAYESFNHTTGRTQIIVTKSTDGGTSWSEIHTKSLSGYNLSNPSIAVDPYYYYIYVVYERQWTSTDFDIYLERYVGGIWYTEIVDPTIGTNDRSPSVVVEYDYDINNHLYIAYERRVLASHIYLKFAKSTNHGDTWTLSTLRDWGADWTHHQPSVAYADSRIYVAFRNFNPSLDPSGDIDVMVSFDAGTSWADHWITADATKDCSEPSVAAVRGLGIVVVAYIYEYSTTNDNIRYSFSLDNGNSWYPSGNIAATTANETHPHLTVDGMGRTTNYAGYIHCIYTKEEVLGSPVYRINGIYYTKLNAGALFNWDPYHVMIVDTTAKVENTSLATLQDRPITTVRNNVPVVVWTDFRPNDVPNVQTNIFATTLGGKYTIDTSPSGLQVQVDGTYFRAPVSFWWAYGSVHSINAPSPQGTNTFLRWSDEDYSSAPSRWVTANTYDQIVITAIYSPTLTLQLSSYGTVPRGQQLTFSGQLTPGQAASIYLFYRLSGTSSWTRATTFSTNANGAYSVTVTVPMSTPTGLLDLVVVWYDPVKNQYAVSNIASVTIT